MKEDQDSFLKDLAIATGVAVGGVVAVRGTEYVVRKAVQSSRHEANKKFIIENSLSRNDPKAIKATQLMPYKYQTEYWDDYQTAWDEVHSQSYRRVPWAEVDKPDLTSEDETNRSKIKADIEDLAGVLTFFTFAIPIGLFVILVLAGKFGWFSSIQN